MASGLRLQQQLHELEHTVVRERIVCKMKYKMIALDLDGTLTNSQKVITPATKEALFQYQGHGGRIILASGRPTQGIVPLAEELNLQEYGGFILAFNGSRIINCETQEVMYNRTLDMDVVKELRKLSHKYKVNMLTYEGKNIYTEDAKDSYAHIEQRITKMELTQVRNVAKALTEAPNKCLMTGEPEYLAKVEEWVREAMQDRINVYRSEPFYLELVPKNIDKAASLDSLLSKLHLTSDSLIACGDGFNDLSMIRYAGLGVAMGNGQEQVKQVADFIAPTNDEDGIVYVLEKFIFRAA